MRAAMLLALVAMPMLTITAQAVPTWHLQLDHAIRPPEQSSASIGTVTAMAVREDGVVYVAEANPARVTRYSATGKFDRVMMREGGGPGEARTPEIAMVGDTLIVFDPGLERLTRMLSDGRVVRETRVSVSLPGRIWTTASGQVVLEQGDHGVEHDGAAVRIFPTGRVDTLQWKHPHEEDLVIQWNGPGWDLRGRSPFSPRGAFAFDPAGMLIIGGSRQSRWVVVNGRGTIRTVTFPDHPVKILSRIRDSVWTAWFAQLLPRKDRLPHLEEVVTEEKIPTTLPPWVSFDVDRGGAWWVGRPGPEGILAGWDIVANGRVIGQLKAPQVVTDRYPTGLVAAFGRERVALLHEDADGLPWIGVYRVVRS